MEDQVHALDYLAVLNRRKWWLIVPVVGSIVVGAALVRYLPKQYKSTAQLAVIAPTVSPTVIGPPTPYDSAERIRSVTQRLMSGPVLSKVAREEGLTKNPDESFLSRMRSSIQISVPDPLTQTEEGKRFDSFIMSYSDSDPARTQRVTNSLAAAFVDDTSQAREKAAKETASFMANQVAASQRRLDQPEVRLRRAKEMHIGQLPEQAQNNIQELAALRAQLDTNATSLRGEQDRLSLLERQVENMVNADAAAAALRAGAPVEISGPEARVASLERELATARLAYTDKHPEVIRLEGELETARSEAAANRQRPVADRVAQLQNDPVYRQVTADRELSRLRAKSLERADEDLRRQIAIYQARVDASPMVEQQLTSVQREYDLERLQYADLSAKLRAATIAENVERGRDGEQFSILYPATYPSQPSKPIPLRVMLLALIGGFAVGGVLMLGREYFDRSVHDVRALRDELDLAVLGEVARIEIA